jgi:hypothetical protein
MTAGAGVHPESADGGLVLHHMQQFLGVQVVLFLMQLLTAGLTQA